MEIEAFTLGITKEALKLMLLLSAPAVGVALIVGLIVSLIQATTQIQEQTLTFVPKLIGVVLTMILVGPYLMAKLVAFGKQALTGFVGYI